MKRFALLLLLLSGPAWAQTPTELAPTDRVILSAGQSKVFEFKQTFGPIFVPGGNDIAAARPLADNRTLSITGMGPGETPIFVYDSVGKEIWRATITVGQEPGRVVRFYDGRSKDYTGYYCSEVFCGRADKELDGKRDPSGVSFTTRTPTGGGGFNESTKVYGPPQLAR